MMVININLEWEKRWVWNTPMLCQHADRLWFSILPTVWIIIKSQTYGRRVTECHLSCLHREEELVLKERHGNVFLKSFLVSEGKLIRQCRRRVLVNYWSRETSVVWKKPFFFFKEIIILPLVKWPPPHEGSSTYKASTTWSTWTRNTNRSFWSGVWTWLKEPDIIQRC